PVTKAAWVAKDPAALGQDMARALEIARRGRPGPVHVSLPGDVLEARVTARSEPPPETPRPETMEAPPVAAPKLAGILDALARARRPLILLGPAMGRESRRASVTR